MFSHLVVIWTEPADANAADALISGAERYLRPIPGVRLLHAGKMVGSQRPVVDQSYQVALNVVFDSKEAHDQYQAHPLHREYVEKVLKPVCKKLAVYDFQ